MEVQSERRTLGESTVMIQLSPWEQSRADPSFWGAHFTHLLWSSLYSYSPPTLNFGTMYFPPLERNPEISTAYCAIRTCMG